MLEEQGGSYGNRSNKEFDGFFGSFGVGFSQFVDMDGVPPLEFVSAVQEIATGDLGVGVFRVNTSTTLQTLAFVRFTGSDRLAVAVGHIDDDGLLDLVFIGTDTNGDSFAGYALQTSPLNFDDAVTVLTVNDDFRRGVDTADIDGDGVDEMFFSFSSQLAIVTRDSGGGTESQFLNVRDRGTVLAHDIDNDGDRDLLLGQSQELTAELDLFVAENMGAASSPQFSLRNVPVSGGTNFLGLFDFNQDGAPDVVTAGLRGGVGLVSAQANDGEVTGEFDVLPLDSLVCPEISALRLEDRNADGRPEIDFAGRCGPQLRLELYQQESNAALTSSTVVVAEQTLTDRPSALFDFNLDGMVDLLERNDVALSDGTGRSDNVESALESRSLERPSVLELGALGDYRLFDFSFSPTALYELKVDGLGSTFELAVAGASGVDPFTTCDLDDDGELELYAADNSDLLAIPISDGTFGVPTRVRVANRISGVQCGDVDEDGR
ncbi:MAG: hypothetical protein AAFY60_12855, partial [Myxococcota bacterium]